MGDLRLLIAADKAAQDNDDPALLGLISDKLQEMSDDAMATMVVLTDVGHMADWLTRQFSDPRLRAAWVDMLIKLAAILIGGLVAERLVMWGLRAPRRVLERRTTNNRWFRLPLVLARWLLELLPIAAFIATALGLQSLSVLAQGRRRPQATLMVNMAYVLSRFLLVLIQAVLMPGSATIRWCRSVTRRRLICSSGPGA